MSKMRMIPLTPFTSYSVDTNQTRVTTQNFKGLRFGVERVYIIVLYPQQYKWHDVLHALSWFTY